MTQMASTIAKFIGVAVVTAVPAGMVLGSYTTGRMRHDYLYGYHVPSRGAQADPVPYTVPKAPKVADAVAYPAPPPSAVEDADDGYDDGFDDEAYLAAYDRQQAGGGEDDLYAPDTDPAYRDSPGYRDSYADGGNWDDGAPSERADLDSEDDPFMAQTRRVHRHRHRMREAVPVYAVVDTSSPREMAGYGEPHERVSRRTIRTPTGTVTVTRAGGDGSARAAAAAPPPSLPPESEGYYAPVE